MGRSRLGELVRERRDRVVERWRARAAAESGADIRSAPALVDAIASMLDGEDAAGPGPGAVAVWPGLRAALCDELREAWADMTLDAWRAIDEAFDLHLEAAVRGQERAAAALADLVEGMVGHDLRSPLNAIAGSAQLLLRRDANDPARRRDIQRILSCVERLDRLIGDVVDVTRAHLGPGIPVFREPARLADLCRTAVEEWAVAHPGRVRFDEAEALDAVECDPARILQAVSNLLGDALDQAPAPSPIVLTLSRSPQGDHAVLAVQRQGPAVGPAELASAFEPARRGDPKRVDVRLYLVRAIASAHGGDVDAQSDARGTTVSVRIPLRAAGSAGP